MSLDLNLQALERPHLTQIVQRALGSGTIEVGDWDARPIHGGAGAASSGVYRVAGVAHTATAAQPWSLVLKVLRAPVTGTTYAAIPVEGWNREVLTYQSGLLDDLPVGLSAPRCYAISEHPGFVWLWLEDISDTSGRRWPITQFARAARHLGRFNGTYLVARPVPAYPWLQRHLLRWRADANVEFWTAFERERDTPRLRQWWPGDLGDRGQRLWNERHGFLDLLDRLPQTLVHGDADRRNLFVRPGRDGDETVAIDWAFTGVAALGEELVNLALASAMWFQVDVGDLSQLADQCFQGYLEGLADVGWRGDRRLAQIGFAVAVALRLGPFLATPVANGGLSGLARVTGHSVEEHVACWAAVRKFAFDQLDSVREFIESF